MRIGGVLRKFGKIQLAEKNLSLDVVAPKKPHHYEACKVLVSVCNTYTDKCFSNSELHQNSSMHLQGGWVPAVGWHHARIRFAATEQNL